MIKKNRKGLENALVTVLLILVAIAAVSLISYYFFGILRHSMVSSGVSITSLQMAGGILTGDLINQGSSNMTSVIIQVHLPDNSTSLATYSNSTINIPPGQTYSFTIAVPKAIGGQTYIVIITVKYLNGQVYTISQEVINQ